MHQCGCDDETHNARPSQGACSTQLTADCVTYVIKNTTQEGGLPGARNHCMNGSVGRASLAGSRTMPRVLCKLLVTRLGLPQALRAPSDKKTGRELI